MTDEDRDQEEKDIQLDRVATATFNSLIKQRIFTCANVNLELHFASIFIKWVMFLQAHILQVLSKSN